MADNKDKKILNVPDKRNVPAIRFVEYTEDYARTTLGKIGNTYNGLTGKSAEDFGQGYPYITYKSIFDNSRVDISRVEYVQISDIEQRNKKQNKVARGDIFFTTSSETPEEVGMTSVLLDNLADCYLNSFCFGYRVYSQEQYLPEYLRFYLRSSIIRKKLFVLAQGSTRFNLSKNEVMRISINMPKAIEQRKIARFLSLLEERIATQNKIIEKLETLIKGIRHKVFKQLRKDFGFNSTIGDILSFEQPQRYIVSSAEYSNDDTFIPVLTANKAFILGYTTETDGIYDKGDCIIIDDFTLDCKYVSFPFKVKSSAIKILTANNKFILRYTYEYLKSLELSTEEHKRHYITEIQPYSCVLPDENTLKTIALVFENLAYKLANEQSLALILNKQRQYLLSKMFI